MRDYPYPLCINCKHHTTLRELQENDVEGGFWSQVDRDYLDWCNYDVSPINGTAQIKACHRVRNAPTMCGMEGKLFEKKTNE